MVIGLAMVAMIADVRRHLSMMPGSSEAGRASPHIAVMARDVDRQPTVHDAGVQLQWLGQTNGEPHRHEGGEAAKYP